MKCEYDDNCEEFGFCDDACPRVRKLIAEEELVADEHKIAGYKPKGFKLLTVDQQRIATEMYLKNRKRYGD